MKITVTEAIRLIQGRINACASYDRDRLLDTIHLAEEKAWNSGKWYGMMDRLVVRIIEGRIVLPSKYGVLEAINYDGVPKMNHPIWYEFSPNGPGSRDCWEHQGIFDLQSVPTVYKINRGEKVLAISRSKNQEDLGSVVTVQGINTDGHTIYRYYQDTSCGTPIKKSDVGEQITIGYLNEAGRPVSPSVTHNEFAYNGIETILKQPTRGPIEIHAMGPRYTRILVELQPNETQSNLRAYRVPEGCRCGAYVEVLAKKNQPTRPSQDHEIINIESPSALINLALSVYYQFDSLDPEKSAAYLVAGLADLNGNLGENLGTQQMRVNVWTGASNARNKRRNRNAY